MASRDYPAHSASPSGRAQLGPQPLPLYLVSSDEAKLWVANRMRIDKPGPGYMHTPITRPRDWFEQMCVEKLVLVKGARKWVNALRARNEALGRASTRRLRAARASVGWGRPECVVRSVRRSAGRAGAANFIPYGQNIQMR
jgi:hypothetical protein